MNNERAKNPFFLPALIVTLFYVVFFFEFIGFGYLLLGIPFVALILSVAGLVYALIRQKRFKGCVFCLILSILELLFPFYLQYRMDHRYSPMPPPIHTHVVTAPTLTVTLPQKKNP